MNRPRRAAMPCENARPMQAATCRPGRYAMLLGGLGLLMIAQTALAAAPNCQVSLGQPLVEFGQVNQTQLENLGNRYRLGERRLQVAVQCPKSTEMVLRYLADGADGEHFGFGERGTYSLQLSDARLDGQPVALGAANSRDHGLAQGDPLRWLPGMQVMPLQANSPLGGTRFAAQLTVQGWLGQASQAPSDAQLQASGLLEVGGGAAELALHARVVPAACTLHLGNGGRVDFGVIEPGRLSPDTTSTLHRALSASVACEGPTRFAVRAMDNRQAGSLRPAQVAASTALFGAGSQANDGLAWSLQFDGALLGDGRALHPLYAMPGEAGWVPSAGPAFFHTDHRLLGFASGQATGAGPTSIRRLEAMLKVELYVAPLRQLDLRDEIAVDGAATLELVYL
ncbi:DUF1120 domain-containing protein [Pantoea sp. Ap-967]|nr:DUF1120 domain-containing protein [Pantoea sp. Ap-967]